MPSPTLVPTAFPAAEAAVLLVLLPQFRYPAGAAAATAVAHRQATNDATFMQGIRDMLGL